MTVSASHYDDGYLVLCNATYFRNVLQFIQSCHCTCYT